MTFLNMWKAWQRRARAFADQQPQRRGVQQQQRLLLEALEDRLVLSNGLSSPATDYSAPTALPSVQSPPPTPAGSSPSVSGSWSQLPALPPTIGSVGTMLLLPNGDIMAEGGGVTNTWYQLSPDAGGNYANGTWSQLASMSRPRLYFGSAVLGSDRVFVLGGEYSTNGGNGTWDNTGEIYNIASNSWSPIPNFPQSNFGDDPTVVLPNGDILAGYLSGPQTYLYNPSTNTWSNGPTKLDGDSSDEETWIKLPISAALPHGGILSYSIWSSAANNAFMGQVYNIATQTWTETTNSTSKPPQLLSDANIGYELGGGLLLPNGNVFQIGANGNTALYDPSTNTWSAGPRIRDSSGAIFGSDDAAASILPDGQVVFTADTGPINGTFAPPTEMFDYDYQSNTITQITNLPANMVVDLNFYPSYVTRTLMLPNGQLLFNDGFNLFVFTPSDGPQSGWRPSITSVASQGGGSYTLMGTQLSDISEGSSYGDDVNVAEDYPIIQLTASNGQVYYATSSNWSNVGVSKVGDTTLETTTFTLPSGLSVGEYQLVVVTNGIASQPQNFIVSNDVLAAAKSVSTSFSTNPQTVALSAAVTDDNQSSQSVGEGSVTFTVRDSNGKMVGSPVQGNVSGGAATANFTLPAISPLGSYTVGVSYSDGSGIFLDDGTDSTATLTINPALVKVVSDPLTELFSTNNQTVTLNAVLTDDNFPSDTVGEGTVTFTVKDSTGKTVGFAVPGTVSGGAASAKFTLPGDEPAGPLTVAVSYLDSLGKFIDDGSDKAGTLAVNAATVKVVASPQTTTFSTNNQTVTLNAVVTDDSFSSDTVGEGTVTFTVKDSNGNTIGSTVPGSVSGGAATAKFTLPGKTPAGPYTIAVSYSDNSGDFSDDGADGAGALTVNAAQVKVVGSPQTAAFSTNDQTVTLNAVVTDDSFSSDTVGEGTVTFTVKDSNGNTVGSAVPGSVSGGAASAKFTLPGNEPAGSYTVAVSYSDSSGNFSDDGTDTSSTLTTTPARVTVTVAPVEVIYSSNITNVSLSAAVADATHGSDTVNEGSVTFTIENGSSVIASSMPVNVNNGTVSTDFSLPAGLAAGNYTLAVSYSDSQGNFTDNGDTSATLTVTPAGAATTADNVSAIYSPNTQSITVNAIVADSTFPRDTDGEGTVTFTLLDGSKTLGKPAQASVSGGNASTSYSLPAGLAAGDYTLQVSYADKNGNFTDQGDTNATLTVQLAPTVTTSPIDQTVNAGANVTFTAAANGNPAPTVQWQVSSDGTTWTDISDATTTTLTLNNVSFALNGNEYRAVFSSSLGTVPTHAATLTVHTPSAITSGNSAVFTVGQFGSFLVTASGSPAPAVTISAHLPSGLKLLDYGNGTASLYGVPIAGINGTYTVTFTAHNGVESDFTQSFTLTINAAPVIPTPVTSSSASSSSSTSSSPTLVLKVPPLLALLDSLLAGIETIDADGGATITDSLFGLPPIVSTYDSSGNLVSVTVMGFNITSFFV